MVDINKLKSSEPFLTQGNWFDIYKDLNEGIIDLILTDPPFGILEKQGWDREIALDEMESTFDYVLKDNGQVIMFCNLELLHKSIEQFSHFRLRSYHVWQKTMAMPISQLMPLPNLEFIIVLKRRGIRTSDLSWNPKDMIPPGKPYIKKSNILESPTRRHIKNRVQKNVDGKRWAPVILPAPNKPNMKKQERSKHPSQKPEVLLRMLLRGYSEREDVVLDPFAGSGSTLISAMKEGRRSMGVEQESKFFNEACERIERAKSDCDLFNQSIDNSAIIELEKKLLDTQLSVY